MSSPNKISRTVQVSKFQFGEADVWGLDLTFCCWCVKINSIQLMGLDQCLKFCFCCWRTERVLSMCTFSFSWSAFIYLLYLSLCIVAGKINLFLCLQERQRQLESMGISLESSGIKVGDDKCYLVNLNADPALNELLVYYLKVRMWTGCLHRMKWHLFLVSNFWLNLLLGVNLDF